MISPARTVRQIISGDTGNPKDRATASLAWDLGPWNMTASVNYVGTLQPHRPDGRRFNTCEEAIRPVVCSALRRVPESGLPGVPRRRCCSTATCKSFTDVDLYAQYAFSKNLSVHASILNLFGRSRRST